MAVGFAKATRLARLLRKGLDHADAGNRIGQHIGDLAPDAVNLLKAGAQAVAHVVDHPADKRQRHQSDERQIGVHGKQNHRRHDDHHHVAGKVRQVQGQVDRDAVALAAHPREQVTGALAAKIFEREPQQMVVGAGAQVGGDALRCQRQDVSFCPAQNPGQQTRAEQARQVPADRAARNILPVLQRNQHFVDQGNRQIGRHLAGGSAQQHQHKTQQQLAAVGLGELPQAQQGPGRWRGVHDFGTDRALLGVGLQRGLATRTQGLRRSGQRYATHGAAMPGRKFVHQAQRLQVAAQGEAPAVQQAAGVAQLQMAHSGMVMVGQRQAVTVVPAHARRSRGVKTDQALVGSQQKAGAELQLGIQVQLQRGADALSRAQLRRHCLLPGGSHVDRLQGHPRSSEHIHIEPRIEKTPCSVTKPLYQDTATLCAGA